MKLYLNKGTSDEMIIYGYKKNKKKSFLVLLGYILTLGILKLIFDWFPSWKLKCSSSKCRPLDAEYVLLIDEFKQQFVEKIIIAQKERPNDVSENQCFDDIQEANTIIFINKRIRYIYNQRSNIFEKLRNPFEDKSCQYFHDSVGLTVIEEMERKKIYGANSIKVHVTPILKLFYTQGLNPFYIFQICSCTLWYIDQYYYFATCIIIISIISLIVQIKETRQTERALKNTIGSSDNCFVYRRDIDAFEEVFCENLVPGDLIKLRKFNSCMHCDAVLTKGSCIVDECMLTGESIPVTKTPIMNPKYFNKSSDSNFNLKLHNKHVLFCGTKILQTHGSEDVLAVVLQTGFSTAKGELVRSILYPKPVSFRFTQDSFKFIACLVCIAFIGMIYTLALMIYRKEPVIKIIVRTLDLLTIVVPPSLPAAMTIGIIIAQKRLRKSLIYCINASSINVSGAIDCFCFDKTGTLTEEGLDLKLVVPSDGYCFKEEIHSENLPNITSILGYHIVAAMASCNSLAVINNELIGDPLDIILFKTTRWIIETNLSETSKHENSAFAFVKPSRTLYNKENNSLFEGIFILRQFTFSSNLQRCSVIVHPVNSLNYLSYVKGSPEMIISLCNPVTIPKNFHSVLSSYTEKGYRLIALAYREIELVKENVESIQREEVETNLNFLGMVILENRLKKESLESILILRNAEIRTIMITGDNVLTAVNVAKNCNIIKSNEKTVYVSAIPSVKETPIDIVWIQLKTEFHDNELSKPDEPLLQLISKTHMIITGKTWSIVNKFCPILLPKLVLYGSVFARFSPDQKQHLIEELQKMGYYVGMCGDGANDCGALKAAHAGISLSEAEASVASPFTSKQPNISCVIQLIREGRAALVTSFGIFKYMACYSLTQFLSVCILYWAGANLTDLTFLYIDLFLLTSLAITFCYTDAYNDLTPNKPKISLLSLLPIFSILSQLMINFTFQFFVWILTIHQPWFEPYVAPSTKYRDFTCHEVTAIFSISAFQYIILAVTFSKGPPYRKTIFSNYWFLLNVFICIVMTVFIVLFPFQFDEFLKIMQLKPSPSLQFRFFILDLALMNLIISLICEMCLTDRFISRLKKIFIKKEEKKMTLFNSILSELGQDAHDIFNKPQDGRDLSEIMQLEASFYIDKFAA